MSQKQITVHVIVSKDGQIVTDLQQEGEAAIVAIMPEENVAAFMIFTNGMLFDLVKMIASISRYLENHSPDPLAVHQEILSAVKETDGLDDALNKTNGAFLVAG